MNKIFMLALFLLCANCCSLDPVEVKEWPDECNFVATIMKFEKNDKEKKIAATHIPKCFDSFKKRRKDLKEKNCRRIIFGINKDTGLSNPVYYDKKKYKDYIDCNKD